MDSITQAALGGVVGGLVLGRKLGWKATAWGIFFGTLPDLDILAYPWLDQVGQLRWHRGLSHSILVIVLASLLLAKPLALLHRRKNVHPREAAWFVFWIWSTHVLIDVFTTYGTQIFEPFSDTRVATNNFFIIDPLFTLPLLFALLYRPGKFLFSRIRKIPRPAFTVRPHRIALTLSSLYVVFSFIMKSWATHQVDSRLFEEIPNARIVAVAPTPLNTLLWRVLIETDDAFWVTYWSPFDREPAAYDFLPKNRHLATRFDGQEPFPSLEWFSRGHWIARPGPAPETTVFIDVRFGEIRDLETRQLLPMFQWHLHYDDEGHLQAKQYRPRSFKPAEALALIAERITGKKDRWESVKSF